MAKQSKSFAGGWIVRNLIAGAVFVALVVGAASLFLSIRTRHGKEVSVPDLSGLSIAEARHAASSAGLRIQVTDSVYMRRMPRGSVVSQLPRAAAAVKPGRKISLTVNSQVPKKVTMPNLIHVSLRQAMAELSSKGLVLGKLNYVSDIATNNVLRQQVRGRDAQLLRQQVQTVERDVGHDAGLVFEDGLLRRTAERAELLLRHVQRLARRSDAFAERHVDPSQQAILIRTHCIKNFFKNQEKIT